jgi:L-asparaginase
VTRSISVLGTGGTISTAPSAQGAVPGRSVGELVELSGGDRHPSVHLRTRDVVRISSRSMTPQVMHQLAEAVREEIQDGADGVVVTHGTDTLEETVYALAMMLDASVPVVVTGAMRPPHHAGADGPANLAGAIVAASDPSLAPYGPVVVHQDEIHLARWVTKLHSARVAAFASPQAGPVGAVVEDRVVLFHGPPTVSDRLAVTVAPDRRVELVWAVAGADGLVVDAIAEHVDGLVVAGTGGGHVSTPLAEALSRVVASGRPVVLSSRCAAPQVLSSTYAGVGSEIQLLSDGLVSAGALHPLKARLRLQFALSAGLAVDDLFARYGGHR